MRYPKLRELREAIKALIQGPYTTRFPVAPHKPYKRFRGRPTPDDEWCVGCGACVEVCPAKAIELIDNPDARERKIIWHYDRCIFCGQCEANCLTEKGVKLSNEYDLAALDRKSLVSEQKKELVLCECCGEIIGTREHLLWLVRKLGPLAYGNVALLLISGEAHAIK
ncbi:MAG: 4Fe-4S ferredoxin, partial [Candidatus Nealsonbacteria bacterium]